MDHKLKGVNLNHISHIIKDNYIASLDMADSAFLILFANELYHRDIDISLLVFENADHQKQFDEYFMRIGQGESIQRLLEPLDSQFIGIFIMDVHSMILMFVDELCFGRSFRNIVSMTFTHLYYYQVNVKTLVVKRGRDGLQEDSQCHVLLRNTNAGRGLNG